MSPNGICSDLDERKRYIQQAVQDVAAKYQKHPLFNRPIELFSEEIRWIAQHGITSLEAYQEVERILRSGARFDRKLRTAVFDIHERYRAIRTIAGKLYDLDDLANAVREELEKDPPPPGRYRHVVIDQGPDFSPEMIRSLVSAIPPNGSLTFFGDVVQQIYGHRMSWRSAGLNITKIWEFKENYRNSKQIARLGLAISKMPCFKDVPDIVEPVAPTADGPRPTLVECSSRNAQIDLVVKQAVEASKTQSVAILFRDRDYESVIKRRLPRTAIRLHRDMTTWQAGPGILYGTYHSAKGLEFDSVIMPFVSTEFIPSQESIETFGEDEATIQDGRLIYVAVTRAKTRLIVTYTGKVTILLPTDTTLYERVSR
jgi:superfamily I DNA/RNA helicase